MRPRASAESARSPERELLIFEIGASRFGLPSADVREVLRAVTIVPLPGAPPVVEGLINVRGRIVPVMDIRRRFHLAPKGLEVSDRLIVASAGPRVVAIRADRSGDLARVDARDLADVRAVVPGTEYVAGVAKLSDGLVLIHDLRTFLSESEGAQLDQALRGPSGDR